MKYILLFQLDEKLWSDLADAERGKLATLCECYLESLAASGRGRHCMTLHASCTATTLRLQAGRCVINDGPFTDTTEVLVAYQIIECRDLDEAIEIAAQFPPLCAGASVEVRPIRAEGCLHLQS